jgi:hypothetical protein
MLATIFSLILVFSLLYNGHLVPDIVTFAFPASFLLLVVAFFAAIVSFRSIMRTQQKLLGCALELFFKDNWLVVQFAALFAFSLVSLTLDKRSFFLEMCWIVLFGVAVDMLRSYIKRLQSYSYYPFLITRLKKEIKGCDESKGLEWIGAAIDSCAKATDKKAVTMAVSGLDTVQELVEVYVKELVRREMVAPPQPAAITLSFSDKIQYVCIFTSERLQWVFENAQIAQNKPVATGVLSELGKLAIFFTKHNLRIAGLPISFVMKCVKMPGISQEILIRASLTLSETIKAFIAHSRETNESLKDLLLNSFISMESIVKMLYKQNKEINPALLMQPFAEIGQFLADDSMKAIPDREDLLKEIRRVFAEFQSLQLVTQSMEEFTEEAKDTTSSFSQDLPYTS